MSLELKTIFHGLPDNRLFMRLPKIASVVMVIALTYIVAQLTWKMIPEPAMEAATPAQSKRVQVVTSSQPAQQSISRLHLFGEVKTARQPGKQQPIAKAPVTRLNLTLRGVIASGSAENARAIIADSSGKENFYALGAKIPGGAELEEIHPTHVIIKRNGRLETLQLPKDVPSNRSVRTARKKTGGSSQKVSAALPKTDYSKETSTILKEFRDVLKTDPQKLMDLVRARPYRENGKLVGYKIRPGKDRKLLNKFGFKSGDVVTSVNGISLDNPINGLEIIKNLTTANSVAVDIKRAGVPQSLSFAVD